MGYPQNLSPTYPEGGHEREVMGYICLGAELPGTWLEYSSHGTWSLLRETLMQRIGIAGNWKLQDIRIALDRGDRPRRDWGPMLTVEQFLQWAGTPPEVQADRDEWVEISDGLEEPVSPSTMRGRRSDGSLDW